MIDVTWGAASDVGRVRAHNEDAYLAQPPVFVVADGMGGHAAGDVASALAISEFILLAELGGAVVPDDVPIALDRANAAILDAVADGRGHSGMGTTMAGAVLVDRGGTPHWLVFNIGDSRVYRWSAGRLEQVSVDHSEVQELVLAGEITREQARTHPRRHVVTRALGSDPAPTSDVWLLPATPGERLMICSDGLFGELDERQIVTHLAEPDPQATAAALVDAACAAGGRDNITVVVVDTAEDGDGGVDEDTTPRLAIPDGLG